MKKFIIYLFLLSFFSCYTKEEMRQRKLNTPQPKFSKGSIVYLKPDSTKAVITYVSRDGIYECTTYRYAVRFTNKAGIIQETDRGDWGGHLLSDSDFF